LIHNSILTNNFAACELLLRKGCPVDSRDRTNIPLLSYICDRSVANLDMIKLFVLYGADVNAVDQFNENCLMVVCRGYGQINLDVVNYLIGQGANVNTRKKIKQTCLGYSIIKGNTDLFWTLLKNGAKIYESGGALLIDRVSNRGSFLRLFNNYIKLTLCSARCVHRLGQRSSLRLLSVDIMRNLCTFL
jgi:ankyrin repeat protein